MNLGQFKTYLANLPAKTKFEYSIDKVFSFRGYCYDVAFSISNSPSTKEELLTKVNQALTETFIGHTGKEHNYDQRTILHFEKDADSATSGKYTQDFINKIDGGEDDLTYKLVSRAFPV